MAIKQEIIDELLANYQNPEDLLGDDGIFKQLKKALLSGRWMLSLVIILAMRKVM